MFSPEGLSPALEEAGLTGSMPDDMAAAARILSGYTRDDLYADIAVAPFHTRPEHLRKHDRIKFTHVKWLLAHSALDLVGTPPPTPEYAVWLHQYLSEPSVMPDDAIALDFSTANGGIEDWHNHSGGIVSLILEEGYRAQERRRIGEYQPSLLTPDDIEGWADFATSLRPGQQTYEADGPNRVMMIDPDEIHRLTRVGSGTMSLLIKFRARDHSIIFDENLRPLKHYPSGLKRPDDLPLEEQAAIFLHPSPPNS
jgi:hypothetical protein